MAARGHDIYIDRQAFPPQIAKPIAAGAAGAAGVLFKGQYFAKDPVGWLGYLYGVSRTLTRLHRFKRSLERETMANTELQARDERTILNKNKCIPVRW